MPGKETRRCHLCQQVGHIAANCRERQRSETDARKDRSRDQAERKCYNCNQRGHIARQCPNALYCGGVVGVGHEVAGRSVGAGCVVVDSERCEVAGRSVGSGSLAVDSERCEEAGRSVGKGSVVVSRGTGSVVGGVSVHRPGVVEGVRVGNIVLDTGCSRTIVHSDLVPEGRQLSGEAITLRCAHGDTVLYPLAEVTMKVGGVGIQVQAAVSDTLPVSVLLGTDVPELGRLLRENPNSVHTPGMGEALVVTRAQARQWQDTEATRIQEKGQSGVQPSPLHDEDNIGESQPDTTQAEEEPPAEQIWTSDLADDLFEEPGLLPKLSRQDKRRASWFSQKAAVRKC